MKKAHKLPIFNRFRKSDDGVTAVEFGLIAPVLFLIFMGIIEFGLIMFAFTVLEGTAAIVSRTGLTGFSVGERNAFIRSEVDRLSAGLIDSNSLTFETLAYRTFDNIGEEEPCFNAPCGPSSVAGVDFQDINGNGTWDLDQGRADAGRNNEVVLYKISYPWETFTPLIGRFIGGGSGQMNIDAVATVKNEAFQ